MGLFVFAGIVLFAAVVLADLARAAFRRTSGREFEGPTPNLVARALAAAPAAWTLGFAALVARAWIRVGERPIGLRWTAQGDPWSYESPNVSPHLFSAHGAVLFTSLGFVPFALALAFVPWAMRRDWRVPAERRRAAAGFAGALGVVVIIALDPGGFWDWYLD